MIQECLIKEWCVCIPVACSGSQVRVEREEYGGWAGQRPSHLEVQGAGAVAGTEAECQAPV